MSYERRPERPQKGALYFIIHTVRRGGGPLCHVSVALLLRPAPRGKTKLGRPIRHSLTRTRTASTVSGCEVSSDRTSVQYRVQYARLSVHIILKADCRRSRYLCRITITVSIMSLYVSSPSSSCTVQGTRSSARTGRSSYVPRRHATTPQAP